MPAHVVDMDRESPTARPRRLSPERKMPGEAFEVCRPPSLVAATPFSRAKTARRLFAAYAHV